jgi:hypothetical protein
MKDERMKFDKTTLGFKLPGKASTDILIVAMCCAAMFAGLYRMPPISYISTAGPRGNIWNLIRPL